MDGRPPSPISPLYQDLVRVTRERTQEELHPTTVRDKIAFAVVCCALIGPSQWASIADVCYALAEAFSVEKAPGFYLKPSIFDAEPLLSTNAVYAKMVGGSDNLGPLEQYIEREINKAPDAPLGARYRLTPDYPAIRNLLAKFGCESPLIERVITELMTSHAPLLRKQAVGIKRRPQPAQRLVPGLIPKKRRGPKSTTTGDQGTQAAAPQPGPARVSAVANPTSARRATTQTEELLLTHVARCLPGLGSTMSLRDAQLLILTKCQFTRHLPAAALALVQELERISKETNDASATRAYGLLLRVKAQLRHFLPTVEAATAS